MNIPDNMQFEAQEPPEAVKEAIAIMDKHQRRNAELKHKVRTAMQNGSAHLLDDKSISGEFAFNEHMANWAGEIVSKWTSLTANPNMTFKCRGNTWVDANRPSGEIPER